MPVYILYAVRGAVRGLVNRVRGRNTEFIMQNTKDDTPFTNNQQVFFAVLSRSHSCIIKFFGGKYILHPHQWWCKRVVLMRLY